MRARPNILLVHWHDLGRHLRTYGAAGVDSPNADRLAAEGVRYDNAYCAGPLCTPARGALFTGRYPHSNGLMGLAHLGWEYNTGEVTLPAYLSAAGYRTALIGLQHESQDPYSLGFDEVQELRDARGRQSCGPVSHRAAAWLRAAAHDERPFFLTVGFFEVHRPYPADEYPPEDPRHVSVPAWLPDNDHVRADLAGLQASIRTADEALGRILDALDRHGLADGTWVIFTTDHGLAMPRAKSTLYDPGNGVSLIQRLPRAWRTFSGPDDALISHIDLLPTILSRLRIAVPGAVQGLSFSERFDDRGVVPRSRIYAEKTFHDAYDPMRAVRTARWKLIQNFEPRPRLVLPGDIESSLSRRGYPDDHLEPREPVELYDLDSDPGETRNLTGPEHAPQRDELLGDLHAWMQETADPLLAGPVPPRPWPIP